VEDLRQEVDDLKEQFESLNRLVQQPKKNNMLYEGNDIEEVVEKLRRLNLFRNTNLGWEYIGFRTDVQEMSAYYKDFGKLTKYDVNSINTIYEKFFVEKWFQENHPDKPRQPLPLPNPEQVLSVNKAVETIRNDKKYIAMKVKYDSKPCPSCGKHIGYYDFCFPCNKRLASLVKEHDELHASWLQTPLESVKPRIDKLESEIKAMET
jgi:DNA repair exonuclease SbcCD ATPase subunit